MSDPVVPAFRDHFSGHAADYGRFRPTYPEALFDWLASVAPARRLAWDVATGNGQAALPLAARFERVLATDASAQQVAQAPVHPRVVWQARPAHESGLGTGTADLVTVAQAIHWFDLSPFYAEVRRVLRPGGVIAAWCYEVFTVDPPVDRVVDHLYRNLVGADWPAERAHIETGYRDLDWPFPSFDAPVFTMEADWEAERVIGYLRTWSAVRRHQARTGVDAVSRVEDELRACLGDSPRRLAWPLSLRVGRQPG